MPLDEAFLLVKKKRPVALPNIGFWEQLVVEEFRLFGTNSATPSWYVERQSGTRPSPGLLFRQYATAFYLGDGTDGAEQRANVVNSWPEGFGGAPAVNEILCQSLEELHNDARFAAARMLAELLQAGRFA